MFKTAIHALACLTLSLFATAGFGQEVRIGMGADITSIDPHAINITPNNNVSWHIFDTLAHVDEHTRVLPGLAESWRAVDPVTWEFKLRRNVKFHDGTDLTAADVIASLERPAKLAGSQFASFVQRIVAKEIVDPHTIRVKTATPYAMVPYDLHSVFIIPAKSAGAASADFDAGKAAIGTGPYRFVRFARGDRVELLRNDQYWGGKPPFERVSLRIMPNDPTRIAALLAGDVDVIENVPTADLAKLRTNEKFEITQKVSWRTIFFHLDQARDASPQISDLAGNRLAANPLKDIRVRRAISKALNRQAIVDRVMEKAAIPAANLVSPPVFGHVESLRPDAYDLDGAKKLLADAGYSQGFAMTVSAPNNRYVNDDQIAQAVAQMLARIGIKTRVDTMPMNVYLTKARNQEFSFAMLGWGSFSGDLALRSLAGTVAPEKGFGTWNWSRYSNAKVDALLEQGFALTDDRKREALAREAMQIAINDYAVIPLHHQLAAWAMKRSISYAGRTDEYTFAHHLKIR
jgi:peptide/nickel transport system substrate-binding protein